MCSVVAVLAGSTRWWRRPPWLTIPLLTACALTAAAFVLHRHWQWSVIDDPLQVTLLRDQARAHGDVLGTLVRFGNAAAKDWHWGLARPSYWVYVSVFYWLPPTLAHLVRVFLLVLAFAVPMAIAYRHCRQTWLVRTALITWAGCVIACNQWLWDTLSWTSLQELPAIALVAVGCAAGRWWRLVPWVLAAWFKAPFAWLLVAWAPVLWRRGDKRAAAAAAGFGIATLLTAAIFAKHGTYTSAARHDPHYLVVQAHALWAAAWPAVSALFVGAFMFGFARRLKLTELGDTPLVLAVGAVLYSLNLLVWQGGAWYAVPPIWLASCAGILGLAASTQTEQPARWPRLPSSLQPTLVAAPCIVGLLFVAVQYAWPTAHEGLQRQIHRDETIAGVLDFARTVHPRAVIGINGIEAAASFNKLMTIDGLGATHIKFVYDIHPQLAAACRTNFYVVLNDQGPGLPGCATKPLVTLPLGTIYQAQ